MDDLEDLERTLRARLDAIGSAPRAVLHVLKLPDHERARRISDFYRDPRTQTFAKLLIDLDESAHARAVVLGELRERELRGRDQIGLVSERSPSLLQQAALPTVPVDALTLS